MFSSRKLLGTVSGIAVLAVLLANYAAPDPSGPHTAPSSSGTVTHTLLLDWLPNPDHSGIYVAQAENDFQKQGVNVKVQTPSGTADAAKMISTGQIDLAISYEPDTIMAAAQGMKVQAVASLIPNVLSSLIITGKDRSVTDLKGMTIGNPGLATSLPTLSSVLAQNGMTESDVKNVSLSTGGVEPLLAGKVDAIFGYYSNVEGVQLAEQGDYTVLPFDKIGVPSFDELVLVANPDRLKSDSSYASFVKKTIVALKEGFASANADPDAAYDAIAPVAKGYDDTTLKNMVKATVPEYDNPQGFGSMDPKQWDSYAQWMHQNGLIDKSYKGSDAMTTEYLPD